jgi:hypothetical protein
MSRGDAALFGFVFEGGRSSNVVVKSCCRKYRHLLRALPCGLTCDANAALRYLKPLVWQPVIATFAGERYKTLGSSLPE